MATAHLTIDLDAIVENWRALDALSAASVRTACVVKADGYGLGAARVARALYRAGARTFFVAVAEEGEALRRVLGDEAEILVFGGHMVGDEGPLRAHRLVPMLNSVEQVTRHLERIPDHPFGLQLDTGMNRLGMEAGEWAAVRDIVLPRSPRLVMSHLACADEPDDPANERQLDAFRAMTDGIDAPRSLAATGGTLLGPDFHFDLTRPGIGLYGGMPFEHARPVVRLSVPVIQVRDVQPGEQVGYGGAWTARQPARIATAAAGYADGLIRAMGNRALVFCGSTPCPIVGRVSMDLLTIDVSATSQDPEEVEIFCDAQGIDTVAEAAGTIGYEILTSLGNRYARTYRGGA
jgi:alanine racemase